MSYMKRTAAVEAFLTGRGIPTDDVLQLDVAKTDVYLHIYGRPLAGVSWEAEQVGDNVHHRATVVQDGVTLRLVMVTLAEVAA